MENTVKRIGANFGLTTANELDGLARESALGGPKFMEFCRKFELSQLNIPFLSDDIHFFSPNKVQAAQEGYAMDAITKEPLSNWIPNATCFAFHGGDPFFVFDGEEEVYWARHGLGSWSPVLFANDIEQFLAFCAAWGVQVKARGRSDVWTEEFELKKDFLDSVFDDMIQNGFDAEPPKSSLGRML